MHHVHDDACADGGYTTMNLFIIRHGQSEADLLGVYEGRADFSLTARGREQARALSLWMQENHRVDMVISSPLLRAYETAEILSRAMGATLRSEDLLMEFDNGAIAGMLREDADHLYPEPAIKWPHTALYGMESAITFRARTETMLSKLLHDYPPESSIAVVAHGGTINMLFRSFLNLPVDTRIYFATGDTGIHFWQAAGGMRKVVYSNKQSHLELMPY